MRMLHNTDDVIDALGGPTEVGRIIHTSGKTVWQWRNRGFPPTTYLVLTAALALKGYAAPSHLWKMKELEGSH
jgi:hypothetical protein